MQRGAVALRGVAAALAAGGLRRERQAAAEARTVKREINALRAEINLLRMKGGHVYTPSPAEPTHSRMFRKPGWGEQSLSIPRPASRPASTERAAGTADAEDENGGNNEAVDKEPGKLLAATATAVRAAASRAHDGGACVLLRRLRVS